MKRSFWVWGLAALILTAGCAVETTPVGGYYGAYEGEYPYTYYGGSYYRSPRIYVHPAPYDRDHYFDRGYDWGHRHWRHRPWR